MWEQMCIRDSDNPVLVEGKLYNKNETVKKIQTGIDGIASTSADLLPYGNYRLEESKAPEGYLADGAKAIDFSITEDGKIVDLTDKSHSVYNLSLIHICSNKECGCCGSGIILTVYRFDSDIYFSGILMF